MITSCKLLPYKDLPQIIRSKEELYALVVWAASHLRQENYTERLALKGMTFMDLADELFLKYLQGKFKPSRRIPIVNNKPTRPSVIVKLPIKKTTAYHILLRDVFDFIRASTKEERARVKIMPLIT